MKDSNIKTLNVCLLGTAFMFVFAAYQTMGNVETMILKCACNQNSSGYVEDFSGSGYTSLAIIYAVLAFTNWFTPSLLSIIGPKVALVIGGLAYVFFISQMLYLKNTLLYAASGILGVGAAIIWTAQGQFLTINSDSETMSRNSAIFWSLMQWSLILGNTFIYFQFQDISEIDADSRFVVTLVLASICVLGLLIFLALRPTPWAKKELEALHKGPFEAMKGSFKLSCTKDMIFLSSTFFYTGMLGTFIYGVYGSSLGFTTQFGGDSKSLVGLHGIVLGVGETLSGIVFSGVGKKIFRLREVTVLIGFLLHLTAFILIFINLPPDSPFQPTVEPSILEPNVHIAILCSFILGFGDGCFNTEIFSILGRVFRNDSASAFAIFRFFQSLASAVVFFYSLKVTMYVHLVLLGVICTAATVGFVVVERKSKERQSEKV